VPRRALVVTLCLVLAAISNQAILPFSPTATAAAPAPSLISGRLDRPDAIGPEAAAFVDATPVRLVIPSITVDARVESRGLTRSKNLDTALDYHNVAWYDLGPRPGEPGNAVINGHVNWWTGNAVFTYLASVRAGDRIEVVRADGTAVWFRVTAKRVVAANARVASLFAPSAVPTLTLITCAGVWDALTFSDTQRLLVSAVLA